MSAILALVVAFLLNSLANILLKFQARIPTPDVFDFPNIVFQYSYLFGAMIAFALNILFYYFALRAFPLSVAYPVMVVASFVIVNIAAYIWFGERVGMLGVFGYLLLSVGLLLIVFPKHV